MPIEPPQPLHIAEALRIQIESLSELVAANPARADYAAALHGVAGAAVLLELAGRSVGATVKR